MGGRRCVGRGKQRSEPIRARFERKVAYPRPYARMRLEAFLVRMRISALIQSVYFTEYSCWASSHVAQPSGVWASSWQRVQ